MCRSVSTVLIFKLLSGGEQSVFVCRELQQGKDLAGPQLSFQQATGSKHRQVTVVHINSNKY